MALTINYDWKPRKSTLLHSGHHKPSGRREKAYERLKSGMAVERGGVKAYHIRGRGNAAVYATNS